MCKVELSIGRTPKLRDFGNSEFKWTRPRILILDWHLEKRHVEYSLKLCMYSLGFKCGRRGGGEGGRSGKRLDVFENDQGLFFFSLQQKKKEKSFKSLDALFRNDRITFSFLQVDKFQPWSVETFHTDNMNSGNVWIMSRFWPEITVRDFLSILRDG